MRDALAATGRKKVVVAGLLHRGGNAMFALGDGGRRSRDRHGGDASGGHLAEAHKHAMDRMVQVGVVPVTWQQVLLERQPRLGAQGHL